MPAIPVRTSLIALSLACSTVLAAPVRKLEKLDRGLVAVAKDADRNVVSWRLLGTDPADLAFNVYRTVGDAPATKLTEKPLAGATFFVDEAVDRTKAITYRVVVVTDGAETEEAATYSIPANTPAAPYLTIPLNTPEGYTPNDTSTGDLDGDGRLDLIVHMTGVGKDNSHSGITDPPILQAYTLDGRMLWSVNLGPNIRQGAHYTQFQVADYNGDGRAELIVKTADGTVDGQGKVIGDATARHANEGGYILKGPEFLSVFDGATGAVIDTIPYQPTRGLNGEVNPTGDQLKQIWGDGYGNRGDRFLAGTAWLDGVHPSAVMCRGYYTRTFLWAVDFDGKSLKTRWLFDSENLEQTKNDEITAPSATAKARPGGSDPNKPRHPYTGQGFHNLSITDVDGDGKDEIVYGAMTVDDDGTGLYSTGWGHGDALHVGDFDPDNPGLEVVGIQERFDDAGLHMHDAKTGKPLWKVPSTKAATSGGDKGEGPGRGISADIDPTRPGSESWALGAGMSGLYDAKGNRISDKIPTVFLGAGQSTFGQEPTASGRQVPTCNFRIYWDGDLLDELLDRNQVVKWDWEKQTTTPLLVADGCESINGTKANPNLSADLFGDWREEIVIRTSDNKSLRIYTTTIPTEHRVVTLMHDPQYRAAITWQNTAYNQPPHVGFDMMKMKD